MATTTRRTGPRTARRTLKVSLVPARASVRSSRLPRGRVLFGRESELARLENELASGGVVTVLGPPGVGKTRLAEKAALALAPGLAAGRAWFVDLSSAVTEDDLRFAVGSVVHDRAPFDGSSLALEEWLAQQGPALVVLDNFEQLTFAASIIDGWSRQAPELRVLITSRERLAIDGERVIELKPLLCPGAQARPEDALTSEAVRLFQARAAESGARLSDDVVSIAEIVRRLDGIPLAIELAAARTRLLSPAEIVARLDRGEDILGQATQRSHARHRTLSDAIEWSWGLLGAEEQRALAFLSLFPQSFDVASAEQIVDEPNAIELIAQLRDKSLVHATDDDRSALYASIREFAAKRFGALDPALRVGAERRFVGAFSELAQRFNRSRLFQDETPDARLHKAVRRERDNLVVALALASRLTRSVERANAIADLAAAIAFLFGSPTHVADRTLERALEQPELADTTRIATLRLARQITLNALGRSDEAFASAASVANLADVPRGLLAFAKVNSGVHLRAFGDSHRAFALHEEAARLLEADPRFPRLVGMNTACIGRLHCDLSNRDEALVWNQRATDMCDRLGDRWLAGLGLANIAQLEQEAQRFEVAEELLVAAVSRFREMGEPQYEAIYAAMCGALFFEWGQHERARHWYASGENALLGLTLPFPRTLLHGGRAALEATDGALGEASRHLEMARRHGAIVQTPIIRLVLELHGGTVELARFAAGGSDAASPGPSPVDIWRERVRGLEGADVERARLLRSNLDVRFALRMLKKRLPASESLATGPVLRHEPGALWFSFDRASDVSLARRGALRRILHALLQEHRERPGQTLSGGTLAKRGWPNERILVDAASGRVRVAIATLRKLGLREVLLTRDDGYLLDPDIRSEVAR